MITRWYEILITQWIMLKAICLCFVLRRVCIELLGKCFTFVFLCSAMCCDWYVFRCSGNVLYCSVGCWKFSDNCWKLRHFSISSPYICWKPVENWGIAVENLLKICWKFLCWLLKLLKTCFNIKDGALNRKSGPVNTKW